MGFAIHEPSIARSQPRLHLTLGSNRFPCNSADHFTGLAIMPSEAGLRSKGSCKQAVEAGKRRSPTLLVFHILRYKCFILIELEKIIGV